MTNTDHPFLSPNRNRCILVERAGPSGAFCYCDSCACATGNFSPGELQSIVNQRFSFIGFRDQVSRDLWKLVGSGNYGLVHEGTIGAEHKRVAVRAGISL